MKQKMGFVSEDVDTIREGLGTASNKQGGVTPDSIYSLHMADAGTDFPRAGKKLYVHEPGQ